MDRMQPDHLLPSPLPALLDHYATRAFASQAGISAISSYSAFANRLPTLSYQSIPDLKRYLPEETTFYLRSRGFTDTSKLIPSNELLLQVSVRQLVLWLEELLSPQAEAIALEPLAPEMVEGPAGILLATNSFGRQLQATGRVTVPEGNPGETALFEWAAASLGQRTEALAGTASRVVSFLRFLIRQGKLERVGNLRFALLTGMPEIETLFGPEVRSLVPHLQVREFYAGAEGVFATQADSSPGLSFQGSACFFELEVGKRTFPLSEARRGEIGSLIVSTLVFPRYRIGDLLMYLGGGRWRVLGKDRRTTRLGYFLKHMFPG
jgi:hypothetical protein